MSKKLSTSTVIPSFNSCFCIFRRTGIRKPSCRCLCTVLGWGHCTCKERSSPWCKLLGIFCLKQNASTEALHVMKKILKSFKKHSKKDWALKSFQKVFWRSVVVAVGSGLFLGRRWASFFSYFCSTKKFPFLGPTRKKILQKWMPSRDALSEHLQKALTRQKNCLLVSCFFKSVFPEISFSGVSRFSYSFHPRKVLYHQPVTTAWKKLRSLQKVQYKNHWSIRLIVCLTIVAEPVDSLAIISKVGHVAWGRFHGRVAVVLVANVTAAGSSLVEASTP